MKYTFLPYNIFKYQLYIFQLEEYESSRFLRSLFKKGLLPTQNLRKELVWTTKAKILAILTFIIEILLNILITYLLYRAFNLEIIGVVLIYLVLFYLLIILSFAFFMQSVDLISPLERYQKNKIIKQAKDKIKNYTNLKIIGITGSYGKTTMKETLFTILNEKFRVVKTSGNNNTPLGISRTILDKLTEITQIFIVEMGEYVKGDVKELCEITPPDISIITGINEAHLERYKTMENAISTKFEIVENAKPNAGFILNADDKLTLENYKKYIDDESKITFYSSLDNVQDINLEFKIKNIIFNEEEPSYEFELFNGDSSLGITRTKILAPYIFGNITASATIAKHLGMNDTEIRLGISNLKPVEHRLESRIIQNNILVIDDTYNGNSDGIKIGLDLLNKFKKRRKVYVTPGLVETGSLSKEIHIQIGKELANVADLVILLKDSVTPYIFQGLKEAGYDEKKVIWYDYSKEMYANLHEHLKQNDVVMMQNDWSDNYS